MFNNKALQMDPYVSRLVNPITDIPILSRKKLVILSANEEKLTWKFLELRGKTVCPAIDRL